MDVKVLANVNVNVNYSLVMLEDVSKIVLGCAW